MHDMHRVNPWQNESGVTDMIRLPSKVFAPFGALKSSWSAPTVIHVRMYLALSVATFSTPVSTIDCKIPKAPACTAKPHMHSVTVPIQIMTLCHVGVTGCSQ